MTANFFRENHWARRGAFVAAHFSVVLALYFVVIDPVRGFLTERAENLGQQRLTLARLEAISAQKIAVEAYARQVADSNARGELIAGVSAGIVDANLQARLKSLAEQAKVTVRSIQTAPAKTLRGASLVGARLDVAGPIGRLHALVRALEGEPPLLLVTSAMMRGQATLWGMAAPEGSPSEPEIEAQFDVYGGALSDDRR